MAFDDIKAEISLLLSQSGEHPRDKYEVSLMLLEKLNALKAIGMPLPQDLVDLEVALEKELSAKVYRPHDEPHK